MPARALGVESPSPRHRPSATATGKPWRRSPPAGLTRSWSRWSGRLLMAEQESKTTGCFALLDEAYETHQPAIVFALFSGGHDSLCATRVAQEWAQERKLWVPV